MTTTQEQHEAKQVEDARKQFPKWRYIGAYSRKERLLRLIKIAWLSGCGPGFGAPDNYQGVMSVGIETPPLKVWTIGVIWTGDRDEKYVYITILFASLRFHYRRIYGGWAMSPGPEPKVDPRHRRKWWQWVKVT